MCKAHIKQSGLIFFSDCKIDAVCVVNNEHDYQKKSETRIIVCIM